MIGRKTQRNTEIDRRGFLRGALATSALLMATRAGGLASALRPERHFAPVKVSRDRIIREVVGLRPYRPEGFKVEAERIGEKLLVHNYGHGGAGITLSWGTASLAVDLLSEPGADPGPGVCAGPLVTATSRFSAVASTVSPLPVCCKDVFRTVPAL